MSDEGSTKTKLDPSGPPSEPHSGHPQKLKKTICKYLLQLLGSLSVETLALSKMYSIFFFSRTFSYHFICIVLFLQQLPLTKIFLVIHTHAKTVLCYFLYFIGWSYNYIQCLCYYPFGLVSHYSWCLSFHFRCRFQ